MIKKNLIIIALFICSCTANNVNNTIPDKPFEPTNPTVLVPTPPDNNGSSNSGLPFDESFQKLSLDLNSKISPYHISGVKVDENNDTILSTDDNDIYKVSDLNKIEVYKPDDRLITRTEYRSDNYGLANDTLYFDDSGNGILSRFAKSNFLVPCGFPCVTTEEGPQMYKVNNYFLGSEIKRYSYFYNSTYHKESYRKILITDPKFGKGKVIYTVDEKNAIFISDINNFDTYSEFKEITFDKPINYTIQNNEIIIIKTDKENNLFSFYRIDYNNNISEIMSFQTILSYDPNNKIIIPQFFIDSDSNGSGTLNIIYSDNNKIQKIHTYKMNMYKADQTSKKEIDISDLNSKSINKFVLNSEGNGFILYTSNTNQNNIYKISNYKIQDELLSFKDMNIVLNKNGNGVVYKNNFVTKPIQSNFNNLKFINSEAYLVKDFKIYKP